MNCVEPQLQMGRSDLNPSRQPLLIPTAGLQHVESRQHPHTCLLGGFLLLPSQRDSRCFLLSSFAGSR